MLRFISDWIISLYEGMYENGNVYAIFSKMDDLYQQIYSASQFQTIIAVFMTVGMAVMVLHFLMDLADKATMRAFNIEYLFRSLVKLFIAYALISHCGDIIKYLVQIGTILSGEVQMSSSAGFFSGASGAVHRTAFKAGLKGIGIKDSIAFIVKIILPFILVFITNVVIIFVAGSRVVELAIRSIFAPVAVADCYSDFQRSSGMRYLKQCFALALQFVLCIVICISVGLLMNNIQIPVTESTSIEESADIEETQSIADSAKAATKLLKKSSLDSKKYTADSCRDFMEAMLGGGAYWWCLGFMAVRLGLIVKSLNLARDICGV